MVVLFPRETKGAIAPVFRPLGIGPLGSVGAPSPLSLVLAVQVEFREFNPFDVWFWLEFETAIAPMEQQYIEEAFDSWFFLGKLGGFNAENLQAQDEGLELSYMAYQTDASDDTLQAFMHNMGEIEFEGTRARCWFDLGTSDAIALDVLINALRQLSREYVPIVRLSIGGEDEDWAIAGSRSKPEDLAEFN